MASDALAPSEVRALKLLRVADARPSAIERIRREAHAVAGLSNPSLVRVHLLFEELHRGTLAMVMDYVDGVSLADALADPRLTIPMREHALGHILRALASVHEHGLAHRDIKLENVILAREFWDAPERAENVKVVDFGIAIASEGDRRLTDLGTVIGTSPYLAPEVIHPTYWGGEQNPKARDVFAFGVLGWYLQSGRHPTGLHHQATLADYAQAYAVAHQQRRGFTLGQDRDVWARVIESCTQVDPRQRPEDCRQVLAMLEHDTLVDRTNSAPMASRTHSHTAPAAELPARTVRQEPAFDLRGSPAPMPPQFYPPPPAGARRRKVRFAYLAIGLTMAAGVVMAGAAGVFALVRGANDAADPGPIALPSVAPVPVATRPATETNSVLRCENDLGDCDGLPRNGCETRLQDSSRHCGACGHDCAGGRCMAGRCQPVVIAAGQSQPVGLSAFSGKVYWVNAESPRSTSGNVFSRPLAGGVVQALFPAGTLNAPQSAATDYDNKLVYITSTIPGAIMRGPLSGVKAPEVFSAPELGPARVALSRTTVYWTANAGGSIRAQEKNGGLPRDLAVGQRRPARLAVQETDPYLYWTNRGDPGVANGEVARVKKTGGPAMLIASNQRFPLAIGADDQHVYWTNEGLGGGDGSLMRARKDGTGVEVLETGLYHPTGLELSGDMIFWTSGEENGEVWQRSKSSGPALRLATGQNHPFVIIAASDSIFWANKGTPHTHDGSIMRLVR